jgi:type II secretory pathway pseudopilin PulG
MLFTFPRLMSVLAVVGALVAIVFAVVGFSKADAANEKNAEAITQAERAATHARRLAVRLEMEGRDRRDQTCTLNERDHLQDVRALRRTYARLPEALDFYEQIAPNEGFRQFLRSAVAADTQRLEKEARVDRAPEFCDEPGYGLPEPDPVIPERPEGLPL